MAELLGKSLYKNHVRKILCYLQFILLGLLVLTFLKLNYIILLSSCGLFYFFWCNLIDEFRKKLNLDRTKDNLNIQSLSIFKFLLSTGEVVYCFLAGTTEVLLSVRAVWVVRWEFFWYGISESRFGGHPLPMERRVWYFGRTSSGGLSYSGLFLP